MFLDYPFIVQPENLTVSFGEFAEFECHVNGTHQIVLEFFIGTSENGSAQIYPHQRSDLRDIEFSANVTMNSAGNISIGKVVIILNSHTLQLVEYFFCKVFGDIFISKRSRKAYISIAYPECTSSLDLNQFPHPQNELDTSPVPIQPTSSQTCFDHPRVVTKSAYILQPCKHQLSMCI